MQTLVTAKKYQKYYTDPIVAKRNDVLSWTPKESEWPGWLWCTHPTTRKEGWVPVHRLKLEGDRATMLENYSAIELDAEVGEQFTPIFQESGWAWCRAQNVLEGWLPLEIFASAPPISK